MKIMKYAGTTLALVDLPRVDCSTTMLLQFFYVWYGESSLTGSTTISSMNSSLL